jgi:hypothetical protein
MDMVARITGCSGRGVRWGSGSARWFCRSSVVGLMDTFSGWGGPADSTGPAVSDPLARHGVRGVRGQTGVPGPTLRARGIGGLGQRIPVPYPGPIATSRQRAGWTRRVGHLPAAEGDWVDDDADRWLVTKVRGGDVEAYEVLIRRHRDRIYRALQAECVLLLRYCRWSDRVIC